MPVAVRAAAERGWRIFPIYARLAMGAPSLIAEATSDIVQLEAWANQQAAGKCSWAVATGHASGILAVEMKGAHGIAAFTDLVLDNQYDETIQEALISQTGYGEAETVCAYFRWPAEPGMSSHLRGTISRGLRLHGEDDFSVLPARISGMSQGWFDGSDLLPAPQWLIDAAVASSEERSAEKETRHFR